MIIFLNTTHTGPGALFFFLSLSHYMWQPPPDASWNGQPVGYQVWYAPLQYVLTGSDANYQQQTVMFTHTRILLSNLALHQDYEVKVAALGVMGLGPFTQPYDIYVGEAGKTNSLARNAAGFRTEKAFSSLAAALQ